MGQFPCMTVQATFLIHNPHHGPPCYGRGGGDRGPGEGEASSASPEGGMSRNSTPVPRLPLLSPAQSRPIVQACWALPPPGTLPRICSPGNPAPLERPPRSAPLVQKQLVWCQPRHPVPFTGCWVSGEALGARCCVGRDKAPSLSGVREVFFLFASTLVESYR